MAFSRSLEVCLACQVSSLVLVSRGGVLVDSWGIWRPQEPRCPVCRSPCRWPSSRMGLHPFLPRWHWRTREESPGPPPEIAQEPEGEKGKGSGQRRRERGRKKQEIISDMPALIIWTAEELPFSHLPLSCPKVTIQYSWLWKVSNSELWVHSHLFSRTCLETYIIWLKVWWYPNITSVCDCWASHLRINLLL